MKKDLIKTYLEYYDYLDIVITKEMYDSVEAMFDEFMLNRDSKGLENDLDEFFNEMSLDIECELESWD